MWSKPANCIRKYNKPRGKQSWNEIYDDLNEIYFFTVIHFLAVIIAPVFKWKNIILTSQFRCWRKFTFLLVLDEIIVFQCRCCGLLYISSESAPKIFVLESISHPSLSSFPILLLPWNLKKGRPGAQAVFESHLALPVFPGGMEGEPRSWQAV